MYSSIITVSKGAFLMNFVLSVACLSGPWDDRGASLGFDEVSELCESREKLGEFFESGEWARLSESSSC